MRDIWTLFVLLVALVAVNRLTGALTPEGEHGERSG